MSSVLDSNANPIEPGDTSNQPVNIPVKSAPVIEATEEDKTAEYIQRQKQNKELHDSAIDPNATLHRVYKSYHETNYIFKDGTIAIFRNKRYLTSNKQEIAELDDEILNRRNTYIYIDNKEREADPRLEDPMEKLKAQLFSQWAAELQKATSGPVNDAGTYTNGPLKVANSDSIAPVAAGGGPTLGVSAQMQNLIARIRGENK